MANNFTVLELWQYYLDSTGVLRIITDVPCHAYCDWSTTEPQKHNVETIIRGLGVMFEPYYCFVSWQVQEQIEPGDTLCHTFIFNDWLFEQQRWVIFRATIAGEESPSSTAIFHCINNTTQTCLDSHWLLSTEDNRSLWYSWGNWDITHDSPIGTIAPWHDAPNYFLIGGISHTASYFIRRAFVRYDTSALPIGCLIKGAVFSFFCYASAITSSIGNPYWQVTEGVQSTPIVPTDFGAQLPYTTVGGQIDIRDVSPGNRYYIHLLCPGLDFIKPGDITKLCLRAELDVADVDPPLGQNHIAFHSRQASADKRPWLRLFYELP